MLSLDSSRKWRLLFPQVVFQDLLESGEEDLTYFFLVHRTFHDDVLPCTVTTIPLLPPELRCSHSQMPCHVPRFNLPFVMGTART